jgi:hypothetical protein
MGFADKDFRRAMEMLVEARDALRNAERKAPAAKKIADDLEPLIIDAQWAYDDMTGATS